MEFFGSSFCLENVKAQSENEKVLQYYRSQFMISKNYYYSNL